MSIFSLDNARGKINRADAKLCEIFTNPNNALDITGQQHIELNETICENLKGASVPFYTSMARYIDWSVYEPSKYDDAGDIKIKASHKEALQEVLAGAIALRAEAMAEVAIVKYEEDAKDSYRADRHMQVLDGNQFSVYAACRDVERANTARRAFDSVMKLSVKAQNAYLNDRCSPLETVINNLMEQGDGAIPILNNPVHQCATPQ